MGHAILLGDLQDQAEIEGRILIHMFHHRLLQPAILEDDRSHHLGEHRAIMEGDENQPFRQEILGHHQGFAFILCFFRGFNAIRG